jgi:glutamate-ammonia-ligase adenylyltransferase
MALTRARPIYGSARARAALAAIVDATLDRPREAGKLVADAAKMRADIARHKPPAGRFDVKLIPGGLIDAEFAVHLLQLRHRLGFSPRLRQAARALVEAGLLAESVIGAHELLTRMLVTLRLVSPSSDEPPEASRPIVARACGQPDWPALIESYDAARRIIAAEWARVSQ